MISSDLIPSLQCDPLYSLFLHLSLPPSVCTLLAILLSFVPAAEWSTGRPSAPLVAEATWPFPLSSIQLPQQMPPTWRGHYFRGLWWRSWAGPWWTWVVGPLGYRLSWCLGPTYPVVIYSWSHAPDRGLVVPDVDVDLADFALVYEQTNVRGQQPWRASLESVQIVYSCSLTSRGMVPIGKWDPSYTDRRVNQGTGCECHKFISLWRGVNATSSFLFEGVWMSQVHFSLKGCECHKFISLWRGVNVTSSFLFEGVWMSQVHFSLKGCECHKFISLWRGVNVTSSFLFEGVWMSQVHFSLKGCECHKFMSLCMYLS